MQLFNTCIRRSICSSSAQQAQHGAGPAVQAQREKREEEASVRFRKENPLISEQFADLKRGLADVSEAEWKAIPEIGDYTIKRRKRFETFSANSDSALAGALATATGNTGNTAAGEASAPGFMTDLTALGQGRKQMLGVNLDRMADSVSGQTTVDPTGYLTSLNSKKVRPPRRMHACCTARSPRAVQAVCARAHGRGSMHTAAVRPVCVAWRPPARPSAVLRMHAPQITPKPRPPGVVCAGELGGGDQRH